MPPTEDPIQPIDPRRVAAASIRGFLYQGVRAVEAWLDLAEDELLIVEGDEDFDRLMLEGATAVPSRVSHQVKHSQGALGLRDLPVRETLASYLGAFVERRKRGEATKLRFVTTASPRTHGEAAEVLAVWGVESERARVASFVRDLLQEGADPAVFERMDAADERWQQFVASVEFYFEQPDLESAWSELMRRISRDPRTKDLPSDYLRERLLAALLMAGAQDEARLRVRTRADLQKLVEEGARSLAQWERSPAGRRVIAAIEDARELERLLVPETYPSDRPAKERSAGQLLAARYQTMPFIEEGRAELLQDFDEWAQSKDSIDIRLVTGPGGSGKTRLFIEWARRLRIQGWFAGFLRDDRQPQQQQLATQAAERLVRGSLPRLVVIDYAEGRPDLVAALLQEVARAVHSEDRAAPPRLRVVLLARNATDWWLALLSQRSELKSIGERVSPFELPPMARTLELRKRRFWEAVLHYRELLGMQPSGAVPPLDHPDFDRVLVLHMAALAFVHGRTVRSQSEALRATLDHEEQLWQHAIEAEGFKSGEARELRERVLPRLVAVTTLVGGVRDEVTARQLATRALGGPDPRLSRILHVARALYAGSAASNSDSEPYLQPLEPDLLGEYQVLDLLDRRSLWGAPAQERHPFFDQVWPEDRDADPDEISSALTVLGRAAAADFAYGTRVSQSVDPGISKSSERWVRALLAPAPERRAIPALMAALRVGSGSTQAPIGRVLTSLLPKGGCRELAESLDFHLPRETVSLRELRLWVAQQVSPDVASSENSSERRASWLTRHALDLSALGRREEALSSAEEAVSIRRRLASTRPDAFDPYLATSLNNLGAMQSELGRREEALASAEEALGIYRRLAIARPDSFGPDLAMTLNNLGNMQRDLGRREQALASVAEASEIYRRLASARPDRFEPALAGSLNNLGIMQSDVGRRNEALASTTEAVAIRRRLASKRPDAFEPDLASSLTNLGIVQSELGRREEALASTHEGLGIYRRLASGRPDAFEPHLASTLNNLGHMQSALGLHELALASAAEAVAIRRRLASIRPVAFEPDLAMSLCSLGNAQSELGRRAEALASAEEALGIYRRLASARPDAFDPYLATSLNNLGAMQSELGRREEALASAEEAVGIYRRLAGASPDAFESDLAMSLNNLGNRQRELGRCEDALASAAESVAIRRRLASAHPDAFEPDLAGSLNNLGVIQRESGRREEALASRTEGLRVLARHFAQSPAALQPRARILIQGYLEDCRALDRVPERALLLPYLAILDGQSASDDPTPPSSPPAA
ncbi:MAG: tetratricopeptide repeat protein [Planctomycetes bacterium]|nr:tetratricopeptide repeat protein [Planctomycetota bacterium]